MVKLRDIALVAGALAGGYFLLRGGQGIAADIGNSLSGFSAGIGGVVNALTGQTPTSGGSGGDGGSGGPAPTPGTTTQPGDKPPFPFFPTPPNIGVPGAIGIGLGNLGIGAAILGGSYFTVRNIFPPLTQRIGQIIKGGIAQAKEPYFQEEGPFGAILPLGSTHLRVGPPGR